MKLLQNKQNQQGFTLIELLVVVGILAVLLAITIVALNPIKHFQDTRNAQRQNDVTTILNAIYSYEAANQGKVPTALSGVTTTAKSLASGASNIDLCLGANVLVPGTIADLPKDPTSGTVTGATTPCAGTAYNTGYTIATNTAGNRYIVAAPGAENGVTISSTE